MSATFLIRIHVPDSTSIASDNALEVGGEDAIRQSFGVTAINSSFDSRIHELISNNELNIACNIVQNFVVAGMESNCWLAKNAESTQPYGEIGTPNSGTLSVHHLISVEGDVWTLSLDIWLRGGI